MSALRGLLLSSWRQNSIFTAKNAIGRPLVSQITSINSGAPPQPAQYTQQTAAMSTFRRGLTGPLSAKMRLPMRGLEEFLDPETRASDKKLVTGRSWTVQELRRKCFADLHKLWFVLYKEKNMIVTEMMLSNKAGTRFPQRDRREKVKRSMRAIRVVVGERQRVKRALLEERQKAAKLAAIEERRAQKAAAQAALEAEGLSEEVPASGGDSGGDGSVEPDGVESVDGATAASASKNSTQ